jgi:hypothetical protein
MYTRITFALALITILFTSCKKNYEPNHYLDQQQQTAIKIQLSKYMDKLPSGIAMEDRWTGKADKYYRLKADSMHLLRYYVADDGYNYFYITRLVPSIHEGDRRATAGRFKVQKNDGIINLEEFFLSNILPEHALIEAADELFDQVIKNEAMDSKSFPELIEWPNDYFTYDKKRNVWDRKVFIHDSTQVQ